MAAKDPTTLAFYATEAEAYAGRSRSVDTTRLDPFLAKLPAGAAILELGCGGGQDSQAMLARGFDVTPTDGSAELAREAGKRLGRPVRVLLFGDLDEKDSYDGVWANACLLHVPRRDLPGIIERIHAALRPGGVFYASFKAGSREGRDRFQRSTTILRPRGGARFMARFNGAASRSKPISAAVTTGSRQTGFTSPR